MAEVPVVTTSNKWLKGGNTGDAKQIKLRLLTRS